MTFHEEYAALLAFFRWAMQESFQGNDLGGADVQAEAVALGLASQLPYDPRKHGEALLCAEGEMWIRLNVAGITGEERYGAQATPAGAEARGG